MKKLDTLPEPLPEKKGWPWICDGAPICGICTDSLPLISVVTPSYNQGWCLEATIRSVLLQGYPKLEYYVIDGGSSDNSVDIIRKYERWLTAWCSEPDTGQSNAINKGFRLAHGEWVAWINSDDYYLPGSLFALAEKASRASIDCVLVAGGCNIVDRIGSFQEYSPPRVPAKWPESWHLKTSVSTGLFFQPSTLMRMNALERVGFLDEKLHFAMDYDLWQKLSAIGHYDVVDSGVATACARLYPEAKSSRRDIRSIVEAVAILFNNNYAGDADALLDRYCRAAEKNGESLVNALSNQTELFDQYMVTQPLSRIAKYLVKRVLKYCFDVYL